MTVDVAGRLGGLVLLGALTLLVLANGIAMPSGAILNFSHLIDLVFHEAGHVMFSPFGRFIAVLGGSLNQVLVPVICTGVYLAAGNSPRPPSRCSGPARASPTSPSTSPTAAPWRCRCLPTA